MDQRALLAGAHDVPERHHPPGIHGVHPFDVGPEEGLEGHAPVGLQHQGQQEVHVELAIAVPGLGGAQSLEAAHVDEAGGGSHELDVVGRRVLGGQVLGQGLADQVELEPGGIAQHLEGPLVRVGDDGDALVAQHTSPLPHALRALVDQLGSDDLAGGEGLGEERRGREGLVVAEGLGVEAAPDGVIGEVDAARRVAEGPGIGLN